MTVTTSASKLIALLVILAPNVAAFSTLSIRRFCKANESVRLRITNNSYTSGPVGVKGVVKATRSKLYSMAKEEERLLRKEIEAKNTLMGIEESKYGIADEDMLEFVARKVSSALDSFTTPDTDISPLMKKIERATKPRAYPLFIAEKGAILLEDTWTSLLHLMTKVGGKPDSPKARVNGAITKKRIVVLGTGWGATAILKDIDTNQFDVTVISPRNFFLFTPVLAGASVGTVEYRSITEPVREINKKATFLEGTATSIDVAVNTVTAEAVVCEGTSCAIETFTVEYDTLIFTVGAQTNTFGIPGVREHCCFLKQVEDARRIRTGIINCFERANLPRLTDEERETILTFAVIGAGPTGVEFASELRDFVEQDGPKYYPNLLKHVRIKVIEASPTVLAPFDKSLQQEAIKQLTKRVEVKDSAAADLLPKRLQLTELMLNSGVKQVRKNAICLNDGRKIPYGLAVWAAGNGPLPITLQLIEALGPDGDQAQAQSVARGRVAVDPWLRVFGGEGKIFAIGDCSCITKGQLPATAQVASQQGEYLARILAQNYDMSPGVDPTEKVALPPKVDPKRKRTLAEGIAAFAIQSDEFAAPFQFLNLGILAYTGGGSALAQMQITPAEKGMVRSSGKVGFGLWRSVYLSKQISGRNRFLVFVDWAKTQIFGRDITRL